MVFITSLLNVNSYNNRQKQKQSFRASKYKKQKSNYLYKSMLANHKGKKMVYLLMDLIFNEAQGPKKRGKW